jgi:hypothetical protein
MEKEVRSPQYFLLLYQIYFVQFSNVLIQHILLVVARVQFS